MYFFHALFRIILVASKILSGMPDNLANLGEEALRRQGVELILNDHVKSFENGKVTC